MYIALSFPCDWILAWKGFDAACLESWVKYQSGASISSDHVSLAELAFHSQLILEDVCWPNQVPIEMQFCENF